MILSTGMSITPKWRRLGQKPQGSDVLSVSSGESPRAKQGTAAAALQVWSPAGRPVLSWLSRHEH